MEHRIFDYQCGSTFTVGIGKSSSSAPVRTVSQNAFTAYVQKKVKEVLLNYTNGAERTDITIDDAKTDYETWKSGHAAADWKFVIVDDYGAFEIKTLSETLTLWNAGKLANKFAYKVLAGFHLIDRMELSINGSEVSSISGFSLYKICKNELNEDELNLIKKHGGGIQMCGTFAEDGSHDSSNDQVSCIHSFSSSHGPVEFTVPTNSLGSFKNNVVIPCMPDTENAYSLRITKSQFSSIVTQQASVHLLFPMNSTRTKTATEFLKIPIPDDGTVLTCQGIIKNVVSVWTNSYPMEFDPALANVFNHLVVSVYKENRLPIMTSKSSANMVGLQGSTEKVFVAVDQNPNKLGFDDGQDWKAGGLVVRTYKPSPEGTSMGAANVAMRIHPIITIPRNIPTFKKFAYSMSLNPVIDSERERKGVVAPNGAVSNQKYPNTILTADMDAINKN